MAQRGRKSAADLATPPVRLVAPTIPVELPPPPDHLSPAMQAWWQAIVRDYDLDPHHLCLLEAACDAWHRMVQARETLARDGLTVTTKSGTKKHPAAGIDSRLAFARLVRELDLDCAPPTEPPGWRPPAIRRTVAGSWSLYSSERAALLSLSLIHI